MPFRESPTICRRLKRVDRARDLDLSEALAQDGVVGAGVILFDPIFQGLAISLMAGEVASLLLSRMTVPASTSKERAGRNGKARGGRPDFGQGSPSDRGQSVRAGKVGVALARGFCARASKALTAATFSPKYPKRRAGYPQGRPPWTSISSEPSSSLLVRAV